jgi:predicted kinase
MNDFENWKFQLRQHSITADVVNLLDGVPQGIKYHPEFDALKHTFYVVKSIYEYRLSPLIEAAFLHDVGKAFTTNIGKDRIYHFGHPKYSVSYIEKNQKFIRYYDTTIDVTKRHMDLPIGHKKLDEPENYLLKVESTKLERFLNKLRQKKEFLKYRFSPKTLYVPIGISGSGKSTYIEKHFPKYIVVSPDKIREELTGNISDQSNDNSIWGYMGDVEIRMKKTLLLYDKVVLDATNVVKWNRIEFLSKFKNVRKVAIVFPVDVEEAIRRVNSDIENGVNRSAVPEQVIRRQFKSFTKGLLSLKHEFHKVIYK